MAAMRLALLFTSLVACGSSAPKAEAPPPPPPATSSLLDCSKVADHLAANVRASTPRPGITPAAVQDMVNMRCSQDYWSDQTKQCMYATKTIREARDCSSTMTDDQRTAIHTAARALHKEMEGSTDTEDTNADWIKHVVDEGPCSGPECPATPKPAPTPTKK